MTTPVRLIILLGLALTLAACSNAAPTTAPAVQPQPAATLQPQATRAAQPELAPTAEPEATAEPAPTAELLACDGELTPAQTEGPYYTPNTPERANLREAGVPGTPMVLTGRVFDADCQPIAGAKVDFWQTDGEGNYDNAGYTMRGHQFTDDAGRYRLETVLPGEYPGRTPHIHVKVFAPEGAELLTSQIYLPGISDQVPDGIYNPALLAANLGTDDGQSLYGFNFVVAR
jgi:protocatechuate 3,4-dioxygenase beta subunit